MQLVVRSVVWPTNLFLLRGYLGMCSLLDSLMHLDHWILRYEGHERTWDSKWAIAA